MCGIAGFIHSASSSNLAESSRISESLLQSMANRGPDGSGSFQRNLLDWSVNLVHTRLSIIDLSNEANQPFVLQQGQLSIVFNGEIYNYRELRIELEGLGIKFRTKSDTEVLLRAWIAWGISSLKKLEGMFSFAILDSHQNKLYLTRDIFGVKPLYYTVAPRNGVFAFASTPIALVDSGLVNCDYSNQEIYNYLAWGQYDQGKKTFFEGISRVLPGELIILDLNSPALEFSSTLWWSPPTTVSTDSFDKATLKIRELFLRSVDIQMRSDVPIGFALSGGIDSSAILCAARKVNPHADLRAFSYVASNSSISEEKWALQAAEAADAELNVVKFDLDDLDQEISVMQAHQGEPFSTSRIFAQYKVFKKVAEHGIKVLLEGQGADELFAGYQGFAHLRVISLFETRQYGRLVDFLRQWRKWPGRSYFSLFAQVALYALKLSKFPLAAQFMLRRLSLRENPRMIFSPKLGRWIGDTKSSHAHTMKTEYFGRRVTEGLIDALFFSYLPQLLRQGDRNAMAHSVENRVPFLNKALVEYVLSLPEHYLISDSGETKYILRHALRGLVPDSILDRRDKIGFEVPQSELWQSPLLRQSAERVYKSGIFPFLQFVEAKSILGSSLKWRYLNLGLWAGQWFRKK